MFGRVKNGSEVLASAFHSFWRHPVLIVPLLPVWAVNAWLSIYLEYYHQDTLSLIAIFGIVFGLLVLLALACSMILELLEHLERGEDLSLLRALWHTLSQNLLLMLPLVFVWSMIDFMLLIIQALLSRSNDTGGSNEMNARNVAGTLAGEGIAVTFSGYGISLLRKGVRMILFLTFPAVAWERRNPWSAARRCYGMVRKNLGEFATGFMLTELAAIIIFIPPGLLFFAERHFGVEFPDIVWVVTIIYMGFAWSFYYYLEIMFCAELFLWQKYFERDTEKARREGRKGPESLADVERPALLRENRRRLR